MRAVLLLSLLVVLACCSVASAAPDGPFARSCEPVSAQLATLCYGGDVVDRDVQATCRSTGGPCQPQADVSDWDRTWEHRALGLQYALGHDLPLRDAPWVGTHNSFNSIAEMGNALSTTDANQQL